MAAKENRTKFGVTGKALPGTRLLVKGLDTEAFGMEAHSIIVINDNAGTYTSANVYGGKSGNLGKNYSPEGMTYTLPAVGSDKWKEWRKRGYIEGKMTDFDVLQDVSVKAQTAKATPAQTAKV